MRTEDPTWTGEFFGSFGVLVDDGDRVQCHICGDCFDLLGIHPQAVRRAAREQGLPSAGYDAARIDAAVDGYVELPGIRDFYGWNGRAGSFIVFDTQTDGLYFAFYKADEGFFDTFATKAIKLADTFQLVTGRSSENSEPESPGCWDTSGATVTPS